MGQKRITIELTEMEARMVRWAMHRAVEVSSAKTRGITNFRKLESAHEIIQEATAGLDEIQVSRLPAIPARHVTRH